MGNETNFSAIIGKKKCPIQSQIKIKDFLINDYGNFYAFLKMEPCDRAVVYASKLFCRLVCHSKNRVCGTVVFSIKIAFEQPAMATGLAFKYDECEGISELNNPCSCNQNRKYDE